MAVGPCRVVGRGGAPGAGEGLGGGPGCGARHAPHHRRAFRCGARRGRRGEGWGAWCVCAAGAQLCGNVVCSMCRPSCVDCADTPASPNPVGRLLRLPSHKNKHSSRPLRSLPAWSGALFPFPTPNPTHATDMPCCRTPHCHTHPRSGGRAGGGECPQAGGVVGAGGARVRLGVHVPVCLLQGSLQGLLQGIRTAQ